MAKNGKCRRQPIRPATAEEIGKIIPLFNKIGHVRILRALVQKNNEPMLGSEMQHLNFGFPISVQDPINTGLRYRGITNMGLRIVQSPQPGRGAWVDSKYQMFILAPPKKS